MISPFPSGLFCSSSSSFISPGSGNVFGASIGLSISPTFAPAACSCPKLIVGLPLFLFTTSSLSQSVLPLLTTTSTPASSAILLTFSSLSRPYAFVSFSNTKCVMPHAFHSFGSSVTAGSLRTNSLLFAFSLVMLALTSRWQSSRNCQRFGPTRAWKT